MQTYVCRLRQLLIGGLLLGVCAFSHEVHAKDAFPQKTTQFEKQDGQLRITVGFREMFDAALKARLRNGFAMTIVMHLYVYEKGRSEPIAISFRTLKAVYDLWDEVYRLEMEDYRGVWQRVFKEERDVIDRLTSFWRYPLAPMKTFSLTDQSPSKYYRIRGIVEVNPMDSKVLKEVRRWLRQPVNRNRPRGDQSIFGSFVSIFMNYKVLRAEKVFNFESQYFDVRAIP